MRYVSFLLVHINVTVQNQLQQLHVQQSPCKILILQHLPHHHFYNAYKKPLWDTEHTISFWSVHHSNMRWCKHVTKKGGKKKRVIMTGNSKLMHRSKSEIIINLSGLSLHTLCTHTNTNQHKKKSNQTSLHEVSFLNFYWNVFNMFTELGWHYK